MENVIRYGVMMHRALTLVASRDLYVPLTLLALHVAAPVELTLAPLHPGLPAGGVAPVTPQKVTTIISVGSL